MRLTGNATKQEIHLAGDPSTPSKDTKQEIHQHLAKTRCDRHCPNIAVSAARIIVDHRNADTDMFGGDPVLCGEATVSYFQINRNKHKSTDMAACSGEHKTCKHS